MDMVFGATGQLYDDRIIGSGPLYTDPMVGCGMWTWSLIFPRAHGLSGHAFEVLVLGLIQAGHARGWMDESHMGFLSVRLHQDADVVSMCHYLEHG